MSPRKLTNSNKQEILDLYRSSPETTSTLADRYGVSSSTISRFLKSNLTELEYEELIQQKRLGRTSSRSDDDKIVEQVALPISKMDVAPSPKKEKPKPVIAVQQEEFEEEEVEEVKEKPKPVIAVQQEEFEEEVEEVKEKPKPIIAVQQEEFEDEEDEVEEVDVATLEEMLGEDLADLDEDEEVIEGSDEDNWQDEFEVKPRQSKSNLQVLPLSEASFPRICYLVIDRMADLITRPLKEFADLGIIPDSEIGQKTLPVFDNQRVARRFSNRSQRVIKVPDGQMLGTTRSHLASKGITRLLIDGKVYSLST